MSLSSTRTNPSMDDPSNRMSPSSAFFSCDSGISTFLLIAENVGELQAEKAHVVPLGDLHQILGGHTTQVAEQGAGGSGHGRRWRGIELSGGDRSTGRGCGVCASARPAAMCDCHAPRPKFGSARISFPAPVPPAVHRLPSTVSMSTSCPRCGEHSTGKFCSHCGAALKGAACPGCNGALTPGAQFCHHCGTAMAGARGEADPSRVPWIVTGVALVAVIALVLFQASRAATDAAPGDGGPQAQAPRSRAPPRLPAAECPSQIDISTMSPQEQADRLFNRVMSYASEGKGDSAAIFAPMAIQSLEMLAPLNAHQHYDLGLVAAVTGDLVRAKSEADAILKKNPNDLLGLTLAIRVAEASQNSAARARYEKRLIAAEPAERKSARDEYTAHGADIDAALKDARGRKP